MLSNGVLYVLILNRFYEYNVAYTIQTRDQKRFTISEVAADWHELMIPRRTMRPSIARACEQSNSRCNQQTYHRLNQPH